MVQCTICIDQKQHTSNSPQAFYNPKPNPKQCTISTTPNCENVSSKSTSADRLLTDGLLTV